MNIHEYQAKQILKSFGVAVQEGIVAETADEANIIRVIIILFIVMS